MIDIKIIDIQNINHQQILWMVSSEDSNQIFAQPNIYHSKHLSFEICDITF